MTHTAVVSRDERRDATRGAILRSLGADAETTAELVAYGASTFDVSRSDGLRFPLPDEDFVTDWRCYARDASVEGVMATLRRRLVQLQFPIEPGMGARESYRRATRAGQPVTASDGASGLVLRAPERVRLILHPSAAGTIPVLVAEEREDFVALMRALTRQNEPDDIPPSLGACMVSGYLNWHRVATMRRRWEAGRPVEQRLDAMWREAFDAMREERGRYLDRFILLSTGDYSGVPADALGLAPDQWRRLSLMIRLEHECAHYLTRRAFGSMRNSLMDELLADYAGMTAAVGAFRADWFMRFLGVDNSTSIRDGGRIHSYRGSPRLSDGALVLLAGLVRRAAVQVERFEGIAGQPGASSEGRAAVVVALAHFTLEELAADDAAERLHQLLRARLTPETLVQCARSTA